MSQVIKGSCPMCYVAVYLCGILSQCVLLTGCQPESKKPPEGQTAHSVSQGHPIPAPSNTSNAETSGPELHRTFTNTAKLYVDSVPAGADVYVETPEQPRQTDESGNLKSQGKTPLTLDVPERREVKVAIVWEMKEYITKVKHLPSMDGWTTRFSAPRPFGQSPLAAWDYFSFDTSQTWVVQSKGNEILALGPVYSLDDFPGNRLCALFIPRGIKPSTFHSLMPNPDSFEIDFAGWKRDLRYRGLSEDQAIEAVECLRRCGKYVAIVKDRSNPNKSVLVASTAQRTSPPRFLTQTRVLDH
jgi:hypothetical protein